MKVFVLSVIAFVMGTSAMAKENCTKEEKKSVCNESIVKEKVDWACKIVEEEGRAGLAKIKAMRYDCCGEPDYVWINDMHPKMVMHPIKPMLDGKDITDNKDPKGFKLFVAFVDAVKKNPQGAWVDYMWTKFGENDATEKKSWVKGCKAKGENVQWVVGSGTWK